MFSVIITHGRLEKQKNPVSDSWDYAINSLEAIEDARKMIKTLAGALVQLYITLTKCATTKIGNIFVKELGFSIFRIVKLIARFSKCDFWNLEKISDRNRFTKFLKFSFFKKIGNKIDENFWRSQICQRF